MTLHEFTFNLYVAFGDADIENIRAAAHDAAMAVGEPPKNDLVGMILDIINFGPTPLPVLESGMGAVTATPQTGPPADNADYVKPTPDAIGRCCNEAHERNIGLGHRDGFCRACADVHEVLNLLPIDLLRDVIADRQGTATLAALGLEHEPELALDEVTPESKEGSWWLLDENDSSGQQEVETQPHPWANMARPSDHEETL
jgi:hypothetical protein